MTMSWRYLSEHLGEIVDISGAQSLSLEALRLQQVFGHIRRVDQHTVQRALFIPVGLEHDLDLKREQVQHRLSQSQHHDNTLMGPPRGFLGSPERGQLVLTCPESGSVTSSYRLMSK